MKLRLLMDDAGEVGKMHLKLDVQAKQLNSTKRTLEAKEADVKEKAHECSRLELVLKSMRTAISRIKGSPEILWSGCVLGTLRYCARSP